MNAKLKVLRVAVFALLLSANAFAAQTSVPNTFQAGTAAKASEVNQNFTAVVNGLNAIEGIITGGNVVLGNSTPTSGNILKGILPFIHNFGSFNTFVGVSAGNFTLTGGSNTGIGVSALVSNTAGAGNTANGAAALFHNTTGDNNTASGVNALSSNTTGTTNTAFGVQALEASTIANNNTAIGAQALQHSTTGEDNAALGKSALAANTTGFENTAVGSSALAGNTVGVQNTVLGALAATQSTGSGNVVIGDQAGITLRVGSGNIYVMDPGSQADESHTIRFGNGSHTRAFIGGIRGVMTGSANGVAVLVDSNGQLGTISSSRRAKDDIADMGAASGVLMKLRPVTFHYKSDRSPKGRTLQYGLVAEEVDKVAPGLVARSADGRTETVYYQFLAPMLLNEFQKQQRTIEAQTARIAELEQKAAEVAELRRQVARMEGILARLEGRETVGAAKP